MIFANKLLVFLLFLSHFACLFLCYSCIFLTQTYTLQAKSSFPFVLSDRVSADASTNTWPTVHRYVADTLPMLSRPTVGQSNDRSIRRPYSGLWSTDTCLLLDRHSVDILTEILTVSQPTYRPLPLIEVPYKTQDPSSFLKKRVPKCNLHNDPKYFLFEKHDKYFLVVK